MKKTAKKIIQLQERLGLTQTEFAKKLGVSMVQIWRWRTGKCEPNPTAKRLIWITFREKL